MAGPEKVVLGVLPSLGGSIQSQRIDRREGLFLGYYIPKYLSKFNEVHYFSYANEKGNAPTQLTIHPNKFRIHRYLYALLVPLIYARTIRQCNLIRVMHLTGAIAAVLAKKLHHVPFVTTYGYNYAKFAEIEGHPLKAKLIRLFIPYLLRQADWIIVTTNELKSEVEEWIGHVNKITLVPNGVDTKRFSPDQEPSRMRQLFPFFQMLSVGRLEKQKNLFFLLEIISRLKEKISVKLTIIGRGSLADALKEKVRQENLPVEFISHVPYESMPNYHHQADCFISTSLAEGHPKALIEAMSSGLPCVASTCAGNSALICHGLSGILLDPTSSSIHLWTAQLLHLSHEPSVADQLGKEARKFVTKNFDIHETLNSELAVLEKVATQKSEIQ